MIGLATKAMFFDTARVKRRVDDATRRVLGHMGGLVRKSAIGSIREAPMNRHAPAGQPPFSHVSARRRAWNRRRKARGKDPIRGGFKGLKHILYSYEPSRRSVIAGPASNRTRSITIPEILEEGLRGIKARPFMGPALEREKPKFAGLWANSVKP